MATLTINEKAIIIVHSVVPILVCKYLITIKIKVNICLWI